MPKAYTAMRDSFIKKGMSSKAAKTKAAKIYNSTHKGKSSVHRNMKESFKQNLLWILETGKFDPITAYSALPVGRVFTIHDPLKKLPKAEKLKLLQRAIQSRSIIYSSEHKERRQVPVEFTTPTISPDVERIRRETGPNRLKTPKEKENDS